jgi:hypothetical protein
MARYSELPINKATHDLLAAVFQFTNNFSKGFRYTVGESLKREAIERITFIYNKRSCRLKTAVGQRMWLFLFSSLPAGYRTNDGNFNNQRNNDI